MLNKQQSHEEKLKNFDPESQLAATDNHYSDKKFWDKVKSYGKQAGKQTIYYSLLLFYTAKSPTVPKSSKMIVVGALSYLIFPVDLIPDFIPAVGLVDDASVIAAAVMKIIQHIDDDVKNKAKQQLIKLFGDDGDYGEIDKQLLG
ncbi:YkvA family protein [Sporosarcina beigongshangi]|uniref:YkvA family protein n=1 Tax=Sporosarcina beigongshangi TaxID=2782538 RepID=UPI00193AD0CE|nr:YkvA family protein [Sporosarcina beigongshangi]